MHQVMMAKSQGALKEGYKQGPWRVARRPLAACYAAASEQDKGPVWLRVVKFLKRHLSIFEVLNIN